MKKILSIIVFAGLVVLAFTVGKITKTRLTSSPMSVSANAIASVKNDSNPSEIAIHISSTSTPELVKQKDFLTAINDRFERKYPEDTQHGYLTQNEISFRLKLLQKIYIQDTDSHPMLVDIYKKILTNKNEKWIVKRQTLINFFATKHSMSEAERDQLLLQVDLRARNTWHLSNKELIQHILGSND